MINAHSETAWVKPSFRTTFKRHRCLIPANGFFEWQKKERGKQPYYGRMCDGRLFAFAGLWDRWEGADGYAIESCTILTTGANSVLANPRQDAGDPPGGGLPAMASPGSLGYVAADALARPLSAGGHGRVSRQSKGQRPFRRRQEVHRSTSMAVDDNLVL